MVVIDSEDVETDEVISVAEGANLAAAALLYLLWPIVTATISDIKVRHSAPASLAIVSDSSSKHGHGHANATVESPVKKAKRQGQMMIQMTPSFEDPYAQGNVEKPSDGSATSGYLLHMM